MSTTGAQQQRRERAPRASDLDMKLEVVVIPVSDVDRAKEFYGSLGWRLDADFAAGDDFRLVQFTPPGSGCSIQFGPNLTSAAPGSAQGLYLIVADVEAARDELVARGVEVSEVFHEGRAALDSTPPAASAARRPIPAATARSRRSAIRTATAGCSRRSRRGCPAVSTPPRRPSRRRAIWRALFGARRPPTASTRSGRARQTRTGPTGTPTTWCASRPARNCRPDRRPAANGPMFPAGQQLLVGTYTERLPHVDGKAEGVVGCTFRDGALTAPTLLAPPNQDTESVVVLAIDETAGSLELVSSVAVPTPACLVFA